MGRRLRQGSLYAGPHICVDHRFPRGSEHESDQEESNLKVKGSPLDALAFTLYEIQALMKLQQFPALGVYWHVEDQSN
jgi:hypothetical protein